MSSYKFMSDEDLAQLMKPRIDELMAFVVPRVVVEKNASEPNQSAAGQRKNPAENAATLTEEEKEFLVSVLEKPNLSVTQRRDYLGLSTHRNDRIKKALLAKGLVVEVPWNLGFETRGIIKVMVLTESGYRALGRESPHHGKLQGSHEHRLWQQKIAASYEKEGYQTEIEMCLNGKRADVVFINDGLKYAVEVGLTANNEVVNVQKDLEAGFDRVLVACRDTKVKKAVEERLKGVLSNEQLAKVKVILLSDFSFVKEILRK